MRSSLYRTIIKKERLLKMKQDYQIIKAWHAIEPTEHACPKCQKLISCDTVCQVGMLDKRQLNRFHALGFCERCSQVVNERWQVLERENYATAENSEAQS